MKRFLFLGLLLVATPLLAINTSILRRGDRVGVLRMSERFDVASEETVARTIENDLPRTLRDRGFDAFDAHATYDDVRRGDGPGAAYYVEVVGARAGDREAVGVGVGAENVYASIGVVVSRVAAEVRLYDGKTLELVDRWDLSKKSTAVVPTSVGVGGRFVWAAIALPFVHYGQYRGAAHDVARQAAERIAQAAQP
ncbi:MAG TPA: hypothetical protein VEO74_16195 [Thermoanaerobaculia bacterium]|nr:hypothetical protein [Thermoanaerobaculia bacterium]